MSAESVSKFEGRKPLQGAHISIAPLYKRPSPRPMISSPFLYLSTNKGILTSVESETKFEESWRNYHQGKRHWRCLTLWKDMARATTSASQSVSWSIVYKQHIMPPKPVSRELSTTITSADSFTDARDELVIAALLHDIGQIVPLESTREARMELGPSQANVGRVGHEAIGASYLHSLGFSETVSRLVNSHVAAKRYVA